MPLLVALSRYSSFSSKSPGAPPRQMRNVFCLTGFSVELWPVNAPFAARQNAGSPSQPFSDEPSKMDSNPAWSAIARGSGRTGGAPPRPRPCGGPGTACAASVAGA